MRRVLRRGRKIGPSRFWQSSALTTAAVCLLSSLYASGFVFRGWIPHDEGTIAQSAERALRGEVPHRDFDELYTGGLTYAHAAAMRLLGVNLRAPRLFLFASFVLFVAAVHTIARRLAPPFAAVVAALVAVAWSVPNYFVSLPSWYNLFFATFGSLALLRFLDSEQRRWLVAAGVCGGLSILAKITGLYYVIAAIVCLLYLEHRRSTNFPGAPPHSLAARVTIGAAAAITFAMVLAVLLSQLPPSEFVLLAIPFLLIAGFLTGRELTYGTGPLARRIRNQLSLIGPFAIGAVAPIAAFVMFYVGAGALDDLIRGLFVLPQARLAEGSMRLPALASVGLAAPYAALLLFAPRRTVAHEAAWAITIAIGLCAALALVGQAVVYRSVWAVARSMPLLAAIAAIWLIRTRSGDEPSSNAPHDRVFVLVTVSAAIALVQFPYASPTYFFYVAPLVALALLAVVMLPPAALKRVHLSIAVFFLAFALLFTNRSYGWNLGQQFIPYQPTSRLAVERGGLSVLEEDKLEYESLVEILKAHPIAGTIYAGPDCPEVYFLAGFANPTRNIFEFLSPEIEDARWMEDLLHRAPVRAVVINTRPLFSPPLDAATVALLEAQFPSARQVGRFTVRFE